MGHKIDEICILASTLKATQGEKTKKTTKVRRVKKKMCQTIKGKATTTVTKRNDSSNRRAP